MRQNYSAEVCVNRTNATKAKQAYSLNTLFVHKVFRRFSGKGFKDPDKM